MNISDSYYCKSCYTEFHKDHTELHREYSNGMKKIIGTLLLISFNVLLFAQNQSAVIKTQAMDMARALLKKDYATFVRYMHPDILKKAGGKDKLIQQMDTANAKAKQFGAEIKKVVIGNPGVVINYKDALQCTLPQTTEMQTAFGSLELETTLIAISNDGGKNWTFIDTSIYNFKEVKESLPHLSPELVIPPAKQPKFTPNQ